MKPLQIETVSLYGPGLPGWHDSIPVLQAPERYNEELTTPLQSPFLTSAIKRRTTQHMQLAIYAADKALEGTDVNPNNVELVFATTEGDLNISHHIFCSLTQETKSVSPTRFHNVILNAAAGHLGILTKNTAGATTVTAASYSMAVGLLQAYTTALTESIPVLYVAYDAPAILQIHTGSKPIDPFAVGFLFNPHTTSQRVASIQLDLRDGTDITPVDHPVLAEVSKRSSAAGSLPLLMALAEKRPATVALPYSGCQLLQVEVMP
ncbi:MAG: beta-ketoacyl synthase chain length factor [Nevskia sp.]|nr:beta-ketoacyl synthase chain length factor [Nevskia sp.]